MEVVMVKRLAAGALVVAILGCSGLMGYGEELGRARAQSGKPFQLTYTAANDQPHDIWLEIDLEAKGSYAVTGVMAADGTKYKVALGPEGSPLVGGGGRMTLNWMESNLGGSSSASGTIYLAELPAVPAGTKVELTGMLANGPGTKGSVEVVVTD